MSRGAQEAVRRFGISKTADLASILPMVALPALGGYLGKRMGGDLGGRIVRARVWFYGPARARKASTAITGAYNCLRDPISGLCAPLGHPASSLSSRLDRIVVAIATAAIPGV